MLLISKILLPVLVLSLGLFLFVLNSPVSAGSCSGSPSVPGVITAVPGPKHGQVSLKWNLSTNVERYDVVFGTKHGMVEGDYQYGGRKIGNGNTNSYTVNFLDPSRKYYFRLTTRCAFHGVSLSKEVSSWPTQ